jgi:SAM-dependent methyltransferase
LALALAREFTDQKVLDYGSGDATFLSMLMNCPKTPREVVGAELNEDVIADCRLRLRHLDRVSFVSIAELNEPKHLSAYDAVICMEVLEHVVEVEDVIETLSRLVKPEGKILISVPIETGLPFLFKQVMRRIAGWRGIGDYPGIAPYTMREFGASVFAGPRQHIARPIHTNGGSESFHDHKGFNWMALRLRLSQRFELEQILTSPVGWLSPHLASQVWFIGRKRRA